MDSIQINWSAIAVVWAIGTTLVQVVGTIVLFMLRKQAGELKREAATMAAIGGVKDELERAISSARKQMHNELEAVHAEMTNELQKLDSGDRHLERRVVVLEQTVQHAPKASDLQGLRLEINSLAQNVARQQGAQEENNRVLRMIHEFLMEKSA